MMGAKTITPVQVDSDMQKGSIEIVLQAFLNQQKVSTIQQLDFSKISDNDWERLGDVIMEAQHPGQAHKAMDKMMGGEGSESLRQMHINMGKTYLGYNNNYKSEMMGGFGGMMSGWNNQSSRGNGFPMMGYGNNALGGYGIVGSISWIALIIFLVSGTYFFIRQARKK